MINIIILGLVIAGLVFLGLALRASRRSVATHYDSAIWPVIQSPSVAALTAFYVDKLGFQRNDQTTDEVNLSLNNFKLTIKSGETSRFIQTREPKKTDRSKSQLVLYVPSPDTEGYHKALKGKELRTSTDMVYERDLFRFYISDPDGNTLCFFQDFHGPYTPHSWDYYWE